MKLDRLNNKWLNHLLYNGLKFPDTEFEVLFPEYDENNNYYKQYITLDIFRDLIKRLLEINFIQKANGTEELDITLSNSNLRMTLDNKNDIQNFCKTNTLYPNICNKRTYKTKYKFQLRFLNY